MLNHSCTQLQSINNTTNSRSRSNNSSSCTAPVTETAIVTIASTTYIRFPRWQFFFFRHRQKKAVVVIIVLTGIFSSSFVQISILRPSLSGARVRVSRNCMCSNVMQSKAMSTTDERCLLYKYHTLLLLVDTRTVKISNTE